MKGPAFADAGGEWDLGRFTPAKALKRAAFKSARQDQLPLVPNQKSEPQPLFLSII
jgi:hypothetical protein